MPGLYPACCRGSFCSCCFSERRHHRGGCEVSRQSLSGKTIIVTGAGAGIGLGIAQACVEAGATVIGATLVAEQREAVERVGARFMQVDVASPASIAVMADAVARDYGSPDGLVNNAGVTIQTPFLDMPLGELDQLWQVNQRSVFLVSQHIARLMIKAGRGGSIVNIASNHARATLAGYEMYAATKGAIVSMTKAMAWSLGTYQIRVNALCPGLTRTEAIAGISAKDAAAERYFNAGHATGTFNTVPQIAATAVFLLSDQSEAFSGAELVADQGMSARLGFGLDPEPKAGRTKRGIRSWLR